METGEFGDSRADREAWAEAIAELSMRIDVATHELLRLIRRFDDSGEWGHQGAQSMAHWLTWRVGMGLRAAQERVRVARVLGELPTLRTTLFIEQLIDVIVGQHDSGLNHFGERLAHDSSDPLDLAECLHHQVSRAGSSGNIRTERYRTVVLETQPTAKKSLMETKEHPADLSRQRSRTMFISLDHPGRKLHPRVHDEYFKRRRPFFVGNMPHSILDCFNLKPV